MKSEIGTRIHELRLKSGMTQAQLAEKLSVSFQAISKWEMGKAFPDIDLLSSISEIFGVSIDYLIRGKEFEKPRKPQLHWIVGYVNALIAPSVLTEYQARKLTIAVSRSSRSKDEEFVKDCLCMAIVTYVRSDDPDERAYQVNSMVSKFGGVLCNESLPPIQRSISKMVNFISARTNEKEKDRIKALKKAINELLSYLCGENASESSMLKTLNDIEENFLASARSVAEARYRIRNFLNVAKECDRSKQREAQTKKRIEEGYFPTGSWPDDVDEFIKEANKMLKEQDFKALRISVYRATSRAVRYMIDAIPAEERPALSENAELKDYAGHLYDWLGRRVGKDDAAAIAKIATFEDENPDSSVMTTSNDLAGFALLIERLSKKYATLKKRGLYKPRHVSSIGH